jgi:hypothetical protein
MAIDRKAFFNGIRHEPFPKKLTVGQVKGIDFLLDEYERSGWNDLRWLAYGLATTKWETAHTMKPITELGSERYLHSKRYWPWIGRGYVQLTWKRNYEAFREEVLDIFGLDIVEDPDNALDPKAAAYIMFEGMKRGTFTGKKLGDYFNKDKTDWFNARRIINGLDKANEIAGIAKMFYVDLIESNRGV